MFSAAALVFKDGQLVVREGVVVNHPFGRTLHVGPDRDPAMGRRMHAYFEQRYGVPPEVMTVAESMFDRPEPFELVPCRA